MRFRAPRSISPSPERSSSSEVENKKIRHRNRFGLGNDDSSESGSDSDRPPRSPSPSPSPSSTPLKKSKSKSVAKPTSPKKKDGLADSKSGKSSSVLRVSNAARKSANKPDQWFMDEIVAAIRLRTRHVDPYEEWEKQIRREAFRTAQKQQRQVQLELSSAQEESRAKDAQRLAALHAQQLAEVEARLSNLRLQQEREEKRLRDEWQARDKRLWANVESVIKTEEDKVKAKLEAEKRVKEEAERKKREEEAKKRAEEEKAKAELARRLKEEEEAKRKKEEEEKKRLEEERARTEKENADVEQRRVLGLSTATQEWKEARSALVKLKTEVMRPVKSNMRSQLGQLRRQITPKISQITSDPQVIQRISTQIIDIINPKASPHPPVLYTALLSNLAKAIILQAETEVTAEKRSAEPLSRVTFNLLQSLPNFPSVFFTKIIQRTGPWAIPLYLPSKDYDGRSWKTDDKDEEKRIMWGYRRSQANSEEWENNQEHGLRISSILRVWFLVMKVVPQQPMEKMFQLPRYWMWFARLVKEEALLERAVAAELIYTALDVLGDHAKSVFGQQWIKMLELIHRGATTGMSNGKLIGGSTPEGTAARVRVKLEVERIIKGNCLPSLSPIQRRRQYVHFGEAGRIVPKVEVFKPYTFFEEPLGISAERGYGYPHLEFEESIGPERRYSIKRKLGWWRESSVRLARDLRENKYVSIKVLTGYSTRLVQTGENIESQVLRQLSSNPLHTVYNSWTNFLCLAAALPASGDIQTFMLDVLPGHGLPFRLAKRVLVHVLRGIIHIHRCGATLATTGVNNILAREKPHRYPGIKSDDGIVEAAHSEPLPFVPVGRAQNCTFLIGDLGYAYFTETEYMLLQMIQYSGEQFSEERPDAIPKTKEYMEAIKRNCDVKNSPSVFEHDLRSEFHEISPAIKKSGVEATVKLVKRCLRLNPGDRPSAEELLKDPWFDGAN
ncbi:hypothetical protein AX16_001235 [Volvariella volvacea WC 439]|nr:hypothetical protein AX16_001235 [Volvariella volvacea WC 439]